MKKHTYTILTAAIITILMSISVISFSSYAVEESSYESLPSESSAEITSTESTFSSAIAESSVVQSSIQSSSFTESSVQTPESSNSVSVPQSSAESSVVSEPSVQSSVPEETSADESSEPESSIEESSEESEEISIVDPFSALNNLEVVLPVDRPDYIPPESSSESSVQSSVQSSENSVESQISAVAEVSKAENNVLNAPPVPTDEQTPKQIYSQRADNLSFLIGIIIWSVIGVAVTALLIVILNLKGNKETSGGFNRGRFSSHKHYK